ncbi:MAG: ribose 5-phosphate isomerase B [Deltaproteobacteria bacterium]|nr:ribose 5-phosphate isomerase B [Deltaproteobacteria bacterium]
MSKKIAIASDHAGREMKEELKKCIAELGYEGVDMGTDSDASVDYPDYAMKVAEKVSEGEIERGILVCGTGIGMSIAANKYKNVRAALASDVYTAKMSREHNDANILVIGGRVTPKDTAREMVKAWLEAKFEGGRHQKRLDKIKGLES